MINAKSECESVKDMRITAKRERWVEMYREIERANERSASFPWRTLYAD